MWRVADEETSGGEYTPLLMPLGCCSAFGPLVGLLAVRPPWRLLLSCCDDGGVTSGRKIGGFFLSEEMGDDICSLVNCIYSMASSSSAVFVLCHYSNYANKK
jgi:hypothetical protein